MSSMVHITTEIRVQTTEIRVQTTEISLVNIPIQALNIPIGVGLRPPRDPRVGPKVQKTNRKKNRRNSKKSKNSGRIWDGLGVILRWFGSIFGTVSDHFKCRKFEGLELKN